MSETFPIHRLELLLGEQRPTGAQPDKHTDGQTTRRIVIIGPASSYFIVQHHDQAVGIVCGQCGKLSWNAGDVANRYCGNCHQFLNPEVPTGRVSVLKGPIV